MGDARVDLLEPVRILHQHLTEALCEQVFDERRVSERRRIWTLTKMAEFWTAVILRAPSSLHQALEEAFHGSGGFPLVQASKQAFFERAKGLRWEFFRDLHDRFTERVLPSCAPGFEADLRAKLAAFPDVFVVDGTTLDRIAHRLKVLWNDRSVILPGKLLVLYDLFRGLPRGSGAVRLEARRAIFFLKRASPKTHALLVASRSASTSAWAMCVRKSSRYAACLALALRPSRS